MRWLCAVHPEHVRRASRAGVGWANYLALEIMAGLRTLGLKHIHFENVSTQPTTTKMFTYTCKGPGMTLLLDELGACVVMAAPGERVLLRDGARLHTADLVVRRPSVKMALFRRP